MAVMRCALVGLAGCCLALLASHVVNDRAPELVLVPVLVAVAGMSTMRFGAWVNGGAIAAGVVVGTVGAVVVGGGSVTDVVPGAFDGPRRLLSTEWPSPLDPPILATLGLLVGIATGSSLVLALRDRWRLLPLLPVAVAATVLIGLSATSPPSGWLLIGLGVIAIVFTLAAQPRSETRGVRGLVVDRTVLASATLFAVAIGLTAGAVAWADRADPRSTDEPDVAETLLDPVEATVAMREIEPPIDLMTIADRSTIDRAAMPSRWRLAAFDVYDGQRWVPSIDLHPIGGVLGSNPDDPSILVYDVVYHGDRIDLVPFPGKPVAVDRDVQTDIGRVAVRLDESPDVGTVVEARSVPEPTLAGAEGRGVASRQVDEIALTFSDQARRLAGDGLPLERLGRLADTLRNEWDLDSEAPGAGLQQALISRFLIDTQRGTREQFVTAYVLLARSIGFDARIAAGFAVPPDELGSTFDLGTEHAAIWPEVRLDDGTWIALDPVPDREVTDDEVPQEPRETQTPAAAQPPVRPPTEEPTDDDEVAVDETTEAGGWGTVAGWVARVGAVTGLVIAPFLVAIGLIVGLKWRRRRARLAATEPAARVRGAWANATDSLVDAGLTIPRSWTDDHIATAAAGVVTGVPHETRRLAAMSSAVTFGSRGRDESARLAADASATAASIDGAIRATRSRWERIKWRLSLRSLRRSTRSPVVP